MKIPALYILLGAFLAVFPIAALAESNPKFRVGVILPLSGEAAAIGNSFRSGIVLGHESLPPEERQSIELLFEDDAWTSAKTVAAYNKLVTIDGIQMIVVAGSTTSHSIAPLAEQRRMPMIAIASDGSVSEGKRFVVNFWVTPEEQTRHVLPEALRRGYKRIARISTIHNMNTAVNKVFDRESTGKVEIVAEDEYPSEVKDFKPFINRVRAAGDTDAILAMLMPGHLGIFARQAREAGVNLPLFGYEIFEDPNEVKASNGALVGGWYAMAGGTATDFERKFRERFPDAATFGAGNGHDVVRLIASGLERRAGATGVNAFLHEVRDFHGALGTYSATGDNRFTLPAVLKMVSTDGFVPLVR